MIQAHHLTKRYGKTVAVDEASFTVLPGRVTGFLGPNGAGKSTAMRMILGLDVPTMGTVTVNGSRYRDLPTPLRSVGALLDAKAVDSGRSAANHLLWLAQSNGIERRRVDEVLDIVGLTDVAGRRVGKFSLGMNQRLGIAAALLGDPDTLMFDEPINGLDPDGILWIRNLMKSLASEGRTVFLSSHLMSEMAQTAEHLIVIGRGKLIADTSVADVIAGASANVVFVRTTDPEGLSALLRAPDVTVAATETGLQVTGLTSDQVGVAAARAGITLLELSPLKASLEEAFMELTHDSVEYHGAAVATPTADPSGAHR